MTRTATILVSLLFALAAAACDVFLDDGDPNEHPCYADDDCAGGWVCIEAACQPASELGGPCDDSWDYNANEGEGAVDPAADCAEGLWCVDGECAEAGGEGEPCRVDREQGMMCFSDFTFGSLCDAGLYCAVVETEDSWGLAGATCVPAPGAGAPCLCDYSGEPICYEGCQYAFDYADGICAEGLTCDDAGACN
jgi:hypothetical protein